MRIPQQKNNLLIAFCVVLVSACSPPKIEEYANYKPVIDVQLFFDGNLSAHGVVKNRRSKVIRYFNAEIDASWDSSGIGTLDETFYFNDGEIQQRKWKLEPMENGYFRASANDVVGEAILSASGNALQMNYVLLVPYKNKTIKVGVDDKMFMVKENVIINESSMSKFGFRVGSVTLTIIKK